MKVGNKVRKISAWCDSRAKELGVGTIVKVEDRIAHIHWQNGQTLKHRVWEIVVIEDSKGKKKPYYETWQIKF
jgi:hypothetical protein